MSKLLQYLPVFFLFFIYTSEAQPSRFCSRLTRECTTECRENGTSTLFDCVVDCTCSDAQIFPLLSYQECTDRFDRIRDSCRGRNCGLGRYLNEFCSTLPGRCCDPNELDFIVCANNETEPLCCDGEWQCPNRFDEFSCSERLISRACCCDPSENYICDTGRRQCCPNDGQWTCPLFFPPTLYGCSDGNIYTRNEMADECCCDPYDQPGRFGNEDCEGGAVCCPDGTWSCGTDGLFSCGGEAVPLRDLTQGEVCTCETFDGCIQVLVCCDSIVFSTPCDALEACYDPQDPEFCTFSFQFLDDGSCEPRPIRFPQ